ncbi:hypothetical protein D1BOALGB6SA_10511 [Olavius sp. associated proteobacterium Delta 1]|nr:hypothetical protein D1BOALGB6SA_10511 [Olavius sp. associated proteobacterium Delta 1]
MSVSNFKRKRIFIFARRAGFRVAQLAYLRQSSRGEFTASAIPLHRLLVRVK